MEVDAQFEAASKATKSFVVFRRFDTVLRNNKQLFSPSVCHR